MMTDVMVDLETSGTDPERNLVIQIAAVKFNYETGEIGDIFDRCLAPVPNRHMDEQCRDEFWSKIPHVYEAICARVEDPAVVMKDFGEFAGHGLRFWSKPTSFDFPFVASYFRQFGLPMPFHFRIARDMNSFISALKGSPEPVRMQDVPFVGTVHDGLDDCIHQLTCLFEAKAGRFS